MPNTPPSWKRIFTDQGFDWSFRMRAGDAAGFFAPTAGATAIRAHKESRLTAHPGRYLRTTAAGDALVAALASQASSWGLPTDSNTDLHTLSLQLEPDLLLVDAETLTLVAACVCMPSSWSLDHAVGKSVHAVHEAVPRLNDRIGTQIDRFLRNLPAGKSFCRENWSITLTDDLDYHPALQRPRPGPDTPPDSLHLRLEHQLFTAIPGGILMGIRISTVPFAEIRKSAEDWQHLAKTIATMPDNVAEYKGMIGYRDPLATAMRA